MPIDISCSSLVNLIEEKLKLDGVRIYESDTHKFDIPDTDIKGIEHVEYHMGSEDPLMLYAWMINLFNLKINKINKVKYFIWRIKPEFIYTEEHQWRFYIRFSVVNENGRQVL